MTVLSIGNEIVLGTRGHISSTASILVQSLNKVFTFVCVSDWYSEGIGRGGGDIEEQSLWEEVEDEFSSFGEGRR